MTSFGTEGDPVGTADGRLDQPAGIVVNSAGTTAWVADYKNHRITVWQEDAQTGEWTHVDSFGKSGTVLGSMLADGYLYFPSGLAVNKAETTIWVVDVNHRITVWKKDAGTGKWVHDETWGSYGEAPGSSQTDGLLFYPHDVKLDPDETLLWVTDQSNHRVVAWDRDPASGSWSHVLSFGKYEEAIGPTDGRMMNPSAAVVDAASLKALVVQASHSRITEWGRPSTAGTWTHAASYGSRGESIDPQDGLLYGPVGIVMDFDETTVWIADYMNGRVVIWQKNAQTGAWSHVSSFGSSGQVTGPTDGKLNRPAGVASDATGETVWVSDYLNNRVTVWRLESSLVP